MTIFKSYIKKYGVLIFFIAFALLISSSIDPYIVGDSFESKKTNEHYRLKLADIKDERLLEISGISFSNEKKLFWLHNDSGNSSDIYGLDKDGNIKVIVELEDTKNVDFEDISIRNHHDTSSIYIADIGNNNLKREEMYIYSFEEPNYLSKELADKGEVSKFIIRPKRLLIDVQGLDLNFEAMMVENKSGMIFLIEKIKSKKAKIYMISEFDDKAMTIFPSYYGEIDFDMYGKQEVVALDISKDDKYILIKTKTSVFMLDRKDFKKNIASDKLKKMPYVEEYQGESITWGSDSLGYYTVSESKSKKPTSLYYYRNVYK